MKAPVAARRAGRSPLGVFAALAALTLAALALAARGGLAESAAPVNPFTDRLWDDGRAEYDVYTGTTERYGQTRATEARMIVVKEDLVRATLVKSDSGPVAGKTRVAIKMNFSADFKTGTYTYHQIATVMFAREDLSVLKEVMAHHELCGITYVRIAPRDGRLVHEAHSYWESEADREVPLDWPEGVRLYSDALPVTLRLYAGQTRPFEMPVWLLPTQISGRSPIESTVPQRATLRLVDVGPLTVPAGTFRAVKFAVAMPRGADTYWFDTRPPYVLLRFDTHLGRSLQLKKTLRLDYWTKHFNGDEKWVE